MFADVLYSGLRCVVYCCVGVCVYVRIAGMCRHTPGMCTYTLQDTPPYLQWAVFGCNRRWADASGARS